MPQRLLEFMVIPQTKTDALLYAVDGAGSILSIMFIAGIETTLSLYILVITALSLTMTVVKKAYDLHDHMKKKEDESRNEHTG